MSVWSTEAVTDFINLFRKHPSLWKIKSPEYVNRNLKNSAYDVLVEFCKNIGFKSANNEFVKKKLQSLRGAFRKELKRVEDGQRSGRGEDGTYQTKLWYFDLLLFLKDQECPKESICNINDDEAFNLNDEINVATNTGHTRSWASAPALSTTPHPDSFPCTIPTTSQSSQNTAKNADELTCVRSRKTLRGVKRKQTLIDSQIDFMKVCSNALLKTDISETDAFGITVAKKLQRMNSIQALYAESVINAVLRKGILNALTADTDVCENKCNKMITTQSRPQPSSSIIGCSQPVMVLSDEGNASHQDVVRPQGQEYQMKSEL